MSTSNFNMNDTWFKNKVLFLPLLLAVFIFLLDKLFGLDSVRKYTETRIEFAFYDEKRFLLAQLKEYNKNKKAGEKLLVLFGTSHMGEFSNEYISKKVPGLTTYNFSAPMAPPSYLYYNLTTIIKEDIPIDYAVLEIIPDIFKDAANEYAIKFSYDWEFMYENRNLFSRKELETFSTANLFNVAKFPPRLGTALHRLKESNADAGFYFFQSMVRLATTKNNGGIPNPIIHEIKEEALEKESREFFIKSFHHYTQSETQKAFMMKFIEKCKEKKIKLILYKPIVSKPLQKLLNESQFYNTWWQEKLKIARENNIPVVNISDRSEQIQCQKFVDVHHLSGGCYPEITDILLERIH